MNIPLGLNLIPPTIPSAPAQYTPENGIQGFAKALAAFDVPIDGELQTADPALYFGAVPSQNAKAPPEATSVTISVLLSQIVSAESEEAETVVLLSEIVSAESEKGETETAVNDARAEGDVGTFSELPLTVESSTDQQARLTEQNATVRSEHAVRSQSLTNGRETPMPAASPAQRQDGEKTAALPDVSLVAERDVVAAVQTVEEKGKGVSTEGLEPGKIAAMLGEATDELQGASAAVDTKSDLRGPSTRARSDVVAAQHLGVDSSRDETRPAVVSSVLPTSVQYVAVRQLSLETIGGNSGPKDTPTQTVPSEFPRKPEPQRTEARHKIMETPLPKANGVQVASPLQDPATPNLVSPLRRGEANRDSRPATGWTGPEIGDPHRELPVGLVIEGNGGTSQLRAATSPPPLDGRVVTRYEVRNAESLRPAPVQATHFRDAPDGESATRAGPEETGRASSEAPKRSDEFGPTLPALIRETGTTLVQPRFHQPVTSATAEVAKPAPGIPAPSTESTGPSYQRPAFLTVRLDDGGTGVMRMRLAVLGDSVRASIIHENAGLVEQLRSSVSELRQSLADKGFSDARLSIRAATLVGGSSQSSWVPASGSGLSSGSGQEQDTNQRHHYPTREFDDRGNRQSHGNSTRDNSRRDRER